MPRTQRCERLFDFDTQNLKPKCTQALQRIFKLCDFDKEGILNDDELNEFQVRADGRLESRERHRMG